MPGLCGIISNRCGAAASVLPRMVQSLRHLPWYMVEPWVSDDGASGVGRVHIGVLPDGTAHSPPVRWMHGEQADGFTRVRRDDSGSVVIENDAFGMMPVFYAVAGGEFVFATELKAVLAHPGVDRSLDARALADLLTFGFVLGEKTLCRGVACLAGGSRLTFDPATARITHARTADFRDELSHQASGGRDLTVLLDGAVEAFRKSVAARTREGDSAFRCLEATTLARSWPPSTTGDVASNPSRSTCKAARIRQSLSGSPN